jgi:hypothetical protein
MQGAVMGGPLEFLLCDESQSLRATSAIKLAEAVLRGWQLLTLAEIGSRSSGAAAAGLIHIIAFVMGVQLTSARCPNEAVLGRPDPILDDISIEATSEHNKFSFTILDLLNQGISQHVGVCIDSEINPIRWNAIDRW